MFGKHEKVGSVLTVEGNASEHLFRCFAAESGLVVTSTPLNSRKGLRGIIARIPNNDGRPIEVGAVEVTKGNKTRYKVEGHFQEDESSVTYQWKYDPESGGLEVSSQKDIEPMSKPTAVVDPDDIDRFLSVTRGMAMAYPSDDLTLHQPQFGDYKFQLKELQELYPAYQA